MQEGTRRGESEQAGWGWGPECLLINKSIVWRLIHSLLRGHGGLAITEPCLCQEGRGGGTWEVARSREATSYVCSAGGGQREDLARNLLRPASAPRGGLKHASLSILPVPTEGD